MVNDTGCMRSTARETTRDCLARRCSALLFYEYQLSQGLLRLAIDGHPCEIHSRGHGASLIILAVFANVASCRL